MHTITNFVAYKELFVYLPKMNKIHCPDYHSQIECPPPPSFPLRCEFSIDE